jgi:membrane-associated phospholipid phosphatase
MSSRLNAPPATNHSAATASTAGTEPSSPGRRSGASSRAILRLNRVEVATILLLLAFPALLVDVPLARWCLADHVPGDIERLLNAAEGFGHGLGVLLIIGVIHQLDPARRWTLPRLLAASLGAGMAANLVKMTIERARPHHFDFVGGALGSFGHWFPFASAGSGGQGFPSAHTATAVGFAAALMVLYPRGRIVFALLAAMVACQRMASGAHFLSDTLCGAAVGCLAAHAVLHSGPVARWFDRAESKWRTAAGAPAAPAGNMAAEPTLSPVDESESVR